MASIPPSSAGAVVIDANIAIALCAKEASAVKVHRAISGYGVRNYQFYAPGVLVAETLYVLCKKLQSGVLSPSDHASAVADFDVLLDSVLPPPGATVLLTFDVGLSKQAAQNIPAVSVDLRTPEGF